MSNLRIDIKLFFGLYIAFILFTVIGTLSHEVGHYVVFKMFGYDARINYMSTILTGKKDTTDLSFLRNTYYQYKNEITNDLDFPEKEKYLARRNEQKRNDFWIILGRPLQTMLTGTIGLALLIAFRKKFIEEDKVHFAGWILIFLSLFWLRQLANLFTGLVGYLIKGEESMRSDETRLAFFRNKYMDN